MSPYGRLHRPILPYTMTIFSKERRTGRELFGKFNFEQFRGVFRFSTQREEQGPQYQSYGNDIDEFLLNTGYMPKEENPTRYYR